MKACSRNRSFLTRSTGNSTDGTAGLHAVSSTKLLSSRRDNVSLAGWPVLHAVAYLPALNTEIRDCGATLARTSYQNNALRFQAVVLVLTTCTMLRLRAEYRCSAASFSLILISFYLSVLEPRIFAIKAALAACAQPSIGQNHTALA